MTNDVELAERWAKRRSAATFIMALVLIVTQAAESTYPNEAGILPITAFVTYMAALILFLVFGGGWLVRKPLRHLMDDETTRENHRAALVTGFWIAVLSAIVAYIATGYEEIEARELARLLLTIPVAGALLRFSALERRSLK